MSGYSLQTSPEGQARWIDREAQEMGPDQWLRELIVNSAEGGATKVVIDGWTPPGGQHLVIRLSDDGEGMTEEELQKHMSTIHATSKDPTQNFGVGSRIACMPRNHAGMDIASRKGGTEAMVRIERIEQEYKLRDWQVRIDGHVRNHVTIQPLAGILQQVPRSSGTAVALHGDGSGDTYDRQVSEDIFQSLTQRFFQFPHEITIDVVTPGTRRRRRQAVALSTRLHDTAADSGVVRLGKIQGMTVKVHWWLLPAKLPASKKGQIQNGVGVLVGNEVLQFNREHARDFGLARDTMASRVVLLVEIAGASMNTSRTRTVLPVRHTGNASVPWKRIGTAFAQHMPRAIERLFHKQLHSAARLNETLASMLDKNWRKNLQPVTVSNANVSDDETAGGDIPEGDGLPSRNTETESETPQHQTPKPSADPKPDRIQQMPSRRGSGDQPCGTRKAKRTPEVEFVTAEECRDMVRWVPAANRVLVRSDAPPIVRDIRNWKRTTSLPTALVTQAIHTAYAVELASTIIDVNGQSVHPEIGTEFIDKALSPESLFLKLCGMQSVQRVIEETLELQTFARAG